MFESCGEHVYCTCEVFFHRSTLLCAYALVYEIWLHTSNQFRRSVADCLPATALIAARCQATACSPASVRSYSFKSWRCSRGLLYVFAQATVWRESKRLNQEPQLLKRMHYERTCLCGTVSTTNSSPVRCIDLLESNATSWEVIACGKWTFGPSLLHNCSIIGPRQVCQIYPIRRFYGHSLPVG